METQRDSPSLGRWSLLLLLLGLVITPATPQTLSYEEAVLRAVDGFNQRSSEKNLYRLLQLDSQPEGVSRGGDGGEGGSAPASLGHTVPPIVSTLFMSGTPPPLSVIAPLSGDLPRAVPPISTSASCLRISASCLRISIMLGHLGGSVG